MLRGCSQTFMPVNLAFNISPLCGNPTPPLLSSETQSAEKPKKVPARLLYKHAPVAGAADRKVVRDYCVCCRRQTVLLHPENVSRPSARQIQHDSGQWPPQGNIYQLLHLDPVALTLDLLPWRTPFTLNLLNMTVTDSRLMRCQGYT